jgi:hypothetical protein
MISAALALVVVQGNERQGGIELPQYEISVESAAVCA